jgi:integrase
MSVKVRAYRRGGWEVDIRLELPDRREVRERRKSPVSSRTGSKRWGEKRERELFEEHSKPKVDTPEERKEVPTLEEFAPRFLENYAKANRQKPSGIAAKETILRVHLIPLMGSKRLNEVGNEDVQRLKAHLASKSSKTINNVLTVLNTLLKVSVEWQVIQHVPCTVKLLRTTYREARFHDFDEYQRLISAAKNLDIQAHLVTLLGGDAGLRCGEMMALQWADIELDQRRLHVRRSDWKGNVTEPKGWKSRTIPLTNRLAAALRDHRHLRSPRVLCQTNGRPLTQKMVRSLALRSAREANIANGGVHVLRHTFCSHLAMRGAPVRAIQELAGHKDITTTQRYMHLSPAAVEGAVRLLEQPSPVSSFGDILETAIDQNAKERR